MLRVTTVGDTNTLVWASGTSSGVDSITAGQAINVDNTDPLNPIVSVNSLFYQSNSMTIQFQSFYNPDGPDHENVWPIPCFMERIGQTLNFTLNTGNIDIVFLTGAILDLSEDVSPALFLQTYPYPGDNSFQQMLQAVGVISGGLPFTNLGTRTLVSAVDGSIAYIKFWAQGYYLYVQAYANPYANSSPVFISSNKWYVAEKQSYTSETATFTGCDISFSIVLPSSSVAPITGTTTGTPATSTITSIVAGSGIAVDDTIISAPVVSINPTFYEQTSGMISFQAFNTAEALVGDNIWPINVQLQRTGNSLNIYLQTSLVGALSLVTCTDAVSWLQTYQTITSYPSFQTLLTNVGISDLPFTILGPVQIISNGGDLYVIKFWVQYSVLFFQAFAYNEAYANSSPGTLDNNTDTYTVSAVQSLNGTVSKTQNDVSFTMVIPF